MLVLHLHDELQSYALCFGIRELLLQRRQLPLLVIHIFVAFAYKDIFDT